MEDNNIEEEGFVWREWDIERYHSLKNHGFYPKKILDIGANWGLWAQQIKDIYPDASVLSIEGNPNCLTKLKENNPNCFIGLLGETEKMVDFHLPNHNDQCEGASVFKENSTFYEGGYSIKLPIRTLDSFNQTFDFIKIDTQGSELDIIKGGLNTILNCSVLQLELSSKRYNAGAPLVGEVISYLYNLDFHIYDIMNLYYWAGPYNTTLYNQSDFIFINKKKLNHFFDIV